MFIVHANSSKLICYLQNIKFLRTWPQAVNADRSTPIRLSSQCIPTTTNESNNLLIDCSFHDRTPAGTVVYRSGRALLDPPIANESRIGPVNSAWCIVPALHASGPVKIVFTVAQPGQPAVISENRMYSIVQTSEPDLNFSINGTRLTTNWVPGALKWPDGSGPPSRVRVLVEIYNLSASQWETYDQSLPILNYGSLQTITMELTIRDPKRIIGSILRPSIASSNDSDSNSGPTIAGQLFCGSILVPHGALHDEKCNQWYSDSSHDDQPVYPESPPIPCPPLESQAMADPAFVFDRDYSTVQYK